MVRGQATAVAQPAARGKIYQKGMSTDALLKKLSSLKKDLAAMEQETVDTDSLDETCKQLTNASLMLHKDRSVKAALACCLADMLRLYAPNAPFTAGELKDIFQFFIHQLVGPNAGLSKPTSPHYADCCYLLESLSSVKSVVLVCDLPNSEDLMHQIFKGFFDLIRPDIPKNLEIAMADILVQLIDESASVPSEVLEILLANFQVKAERANPSAFSLSTEVCDGTKEKLQKYVAQYFNEAIVSAAEEEDTEEREKALRSTHSLIVQINKRVPALLLNVVPQIEEELRAADAMLRQIAIKTLGQMFAEGSGKSAAVVAGVVSVAGTSSAGVSAPGDLARKYASTWREWLGRSKDKLPALRVSWVEATAGLMASHPELKADLSRVVVEKLTDPDERVRGAMARVLAGIDYETALHHVESKVLKELAERCRDKKPSVRAVAMDALGRLYRLARNELEAGDPAAVSQFAWIPHALIGCLHASNAPEMRLAVAAALDKYVLRLPAGAGPTFGAEDEARWVDRLLLVVAHLDDGTLKGLLGQLSNLQRQRGPLIAYVEACEAYNGGASEDDETRKKLAHYIKLCARLMPDEERGVRDLQAIAKANDSRSLRLLRTCFDASTDLAGLVKARAELLRRVKENQASAVESVENLLRLGSFWILNRSSVPTLLKRVAGEPQSTRKAAANLLTFIAKRQPTFFKQSQQTLWKAISEDEASEALTRAAIQALASLAAADTPCIAMDAKAVSRVSRHARGADVDNAKQAAKLLAVVSRGGATSKSAAAARSGVDELAQTLSTRMTTDSGVVLVASLSSMSQIIKHAPDAAAPVGDAVTKHVLGSIIMGAWPEDQRSKAGGDDAEEDGGENWVEDGQMSPELRAKLLGLAILARRCIAYADAPGSEAIATPVLRLLFATVNQGEPRPQFATAASRSRMRLQAAILILKLARQPALERLIQREFVNLALVVQDECFHTRSRFIFRLLKYQTLQLLPPRFNAIPFLAAFDPDAENRDMVRSWASGAKGMPAEARMKLFDVPFVRLLHLLAHHPDFARSTAEEARDMARYVAFFLDLAASASNIHLLYHLAGRLKGVQDSEGEGEFSDNLYALSELAQLMIKRRAHQHNWVLLSYPGKVQLPSDIFKPLPNRDRQKEILETTYLPSGVEEALGEIKMTRTGPPKAKSSKPAAGAKRKQPSGEPGAKKRKAPKAKKPKRTRTGANEEDDLGETTEEEEEDESSEGESEGEEPEAGDGSDEDAAAPSKRTSKKRRGAAGEGDEDEGESSLSSEEEDEEALQAELNKDEGGRGARTKAKELQRVKERNERKRRRKAALEAGDDEDSEEEGGRSRPRPRATAASKK